jgi:fluoride exporter
MEGTAMARMRVIAAPGAGGRTILRRLRGLDTTLAVGLGGAVGSLGRYGLSLAIPHPPSGFPWSTFLTNVLGCFAIGVLMVLVVDLGAHRLLRPFLAVGVLGGFTTFSAYAVEANALLRQGAIMAGLLYVCGTLVTALGAVVVATHLTRMVVRSLAEPQTEPGVS